MFTRCYKFFTNKAELRNIYINKTQQIILLEQNKSIIKNRFYIALVRILVFLNLNCVLDYFSLNYLYLKDNMYFYYDKIPLKFKSKLIVSITYNNYDFTDIIKKYNNNVPIFIIFANEDLYSKQYKYYNEYCSDIITLDLLNFNIYEKKVYNFNDIKYKKISDLI